MDYIKLDNYGDRISIEESIIDKSNGKIVGFTYQGQDKEGRYTKGTLEISADFYSDEDGALYYTRIKHPMKSNGKIADINFKTKNISTLDKYINYIDNIVSKNESLPAKVYRYDTAANKTEDEYYININYNGVDISLGSFNREEEVLVDGNQAILSLHDRVEAVYTFYNFGYRITEINDKGFVNAISNIDFTTSNRHCIASVSNIEKNTSILSGIINLSLLPSHLENNTFDVDIEYDEFGIINKASDDNVLYEECRFEDNIIDTIMSLHPLYFDILDNSLSYRYNLYCLNQFDYNYDNRFAKYTRVVYKIREDKILDIIKDIKAGENAGHPVLEMIDDIKLSKDNNGSWIKNI